MKIIKLNADDLACLRDLIRLYALVFNEKVSLPSDAYLQKLLEQPSVFFFVAQKDGRVVGGLTAHVLPSVYFSSNEVYVYDLAVETALQRQGIGAALMKELQHYCRSQGFREVFLQADTVDDYALRFYGKIGGRREDVVHYTFPL